jgi:hypothetical protein
MSGGYIWCPVQCGTCNGAGRLPATAAVAFTQREPVPVVHPSLIEARRSEAEHRAYMQQRARRRLAAGAAVGIAAIAAVERLLKGRAKGEP